VTYGKQISVMLTFDLWPLTVRAILTGHHVDSPRNKHCEDESISLR